MKLLRVWQVSGQVPLAFTLSDGDSDVAQPLSRQERGLCLSPRWFPRAQTGPSARRARGRIWQGSVVLGVSEPLLWAEGLRREEEEWGVRISWWGWGRPQAPVEWG